MLAPGGMSGACCGLQTERSETIGESVKVGVIGTIWYADLMHLPTLQSHPQAQIAAICGRSREPAAALAKKYAIPAMHYDYREMIEQGKLDAVVIATPDDLHYPMTMAALDAGLHVICEKPMASTVAQAEAASVKHMIFFTQRWLPSFQTVHELLADGLIGRCFSCHFHLFADYGGRLTGWRFDALRGGGILGDAASHIIDRVHWYLGDIVKVNASMKIFTDLADEKRTPDHTNNAVLLAFELANGAHGTICCNSVAHVGEQGQQNIMMIHGDQGSLEATSSFAGSEIRVARRDEPTFRTVPIPDRFWGDVDHSQPYLGQMLESLTKRSVGQRMFVDAILNDSPITPDFHDGLNVQKVLAAAAESQQRGCWVVVE